MSELEQREQIIVPLVGMAVDPHRMDEVADAVAAVREAQRILSEVRGDLQQLLADEAQRQGTKTLHLGNATVTVSGGPEKVYDQEVLARLQEVGLPEDRYNELVKARIEYRVDRNVIRQLRGSGNPDYIDIIDKAESIEERPYYVSVKR